MSYQLHMQNFYDVNMYSIFQTANLEMVFWNTTHVSLRIAISIKCYKSLATM